MSIDGLESTHDFLRKKDSFQFTISIVNNADIRSLIMATLSWLNYKEIPDVAQLTKTSNVGDVR